MAEQCSESECGHQAGTCQHLAHVARCIRLAHRRQPQQRRPGQCQHSAPPPGPHAERHGRCQQRGQARHECSHQAGGEQRRGDQAEHRRRRAAAHRAQPRRVHRRRRGEEGMRLVERVPDQVQQRQRVQAQAALHHHEAHLRHRRPGQPHLDADARQHHHAGEQRGGQTDAHQQPARQRRGVEQRRKADQHEAAEVDHTGVQQRRHRRGRLHHLDQPAVHRQQGHAQHDREHEANRTRLQGGRGTVGLEVAPERRQRTRAHLVPGQRRRGDQQQVGEAVGQALLVRRQQREGTVAVETQQRLQGHADGRPGEDQHQPMVGQQQQVHRGQHTAERRHIARLARLALEVARREGGDHRAQPLHQHGHPGASQRGGEARQHRTGCPRRASDLQAEAQQGAHQRSHRKPAQAPPARRRRRAAPMRHGGEHQDRGQQRTGQQQEACRGHRGLSMGRTAGC